MVPEASGEGFQPIPERGCSAELRFFTLDWHFAGVRLNRGGLFIQRVARRTNREYVNIDPSWHAVRIAQ